MYKVYCNDKLLFHPNDEELTLLEPVLTTELNKSGTFKFGILPSHPLYYGIAKMKSIIRVYDDSKLLYLGRVYNDVSLLNLKKTVECEGQLAFLNDSIQRPYNFTGAVNELFTLLIENHNKDVEEIKQFKVGKVTVDQEVINRYSSVYNNTFENIQEKLIDYFGGYLIVRNEEDGAYIDYLQDLTEVCEQGVNFGENLIDVEKEVNAQDIATAIIPLGNTIETDEDSSTEEKRYTIESVNGGKDYIFSQDAVDQHGWIFKKVEFETSNPTELLRLGNEYLENVIKQNVSINLTAVDLHLIDRSIEEFDIGIRIPVKSALHGLDDTYLATKKTTYLLQPDNNKLELGYSYQTFTDKQNKINSSITQEGNTGSVVERENITLLNDVKSYSSETAPTYKKSSSLVEINGAIKTTKATGGGIVFGLLPVGYRPYSGNINVSCQSGSNTWMLTISSDGTLTASQYSGTLTGVEELSFHVIFMI